jgi:putative intracellular protease/amidase
MALYGSDGTRFVLDDDGGSDNRSLLTFGSNSLPTRPAVAPVSSPEYRDGHDGHLNAGQHYLAVTQHNGTFATNGWFATSTGASTGGITLEIRTNLPPAACSPADLGMAGGLSGGDGVLDNNDFIAFINHFFAQDPIADMGIAGGLPGADSVWDNNDFIAFINQFFAGC